MTERRGDPGLSDLSRALAAPERSPLGRLLRDDLEEEQASRFWRVIEHRSQGRTGHRWHRTLALVAALSLLLGAFLYFGPVPGQGPLRLTSGGTPIVLSGTPALPVALADGSQIELATGSRLEVLRNDARSFVTALRRGEGTFEVRPGGSRRWVVEAGLARVEVLGTRFNLRRAPDSLRVSVQRGVVLVVSEALPGGARRLTAGQQLEIRDPAASSSAAREPTRPSGSTLPAILEPSAKSEPDRRRTPALGAISSPGPVSGTGGVSGPGSTRAGVPSSTDAAPASDGSPVSPDIEAHLAAADAARQRGDLAGAIRHLEQVVQGGAAHDLRRGMAALSLARLALRSDPVRAARALDLSMASMPSSLAEDALARLVEAEARAGRAEQAARLADEYFRRFPRGHRIQDVKRWLEP